MDSNSLSDDHLTVAAASDRGMALTRGAFSCRAITGEPHPLALVAPAPTLLARAGLMGNRIIIRFPFWSAWLLRGMDPLGYRRTKGPGTYCTSASWTGPERWSLDEPDCSSRCRSSNDCLHPGTGRPDFLRTIDPGTYYTNASLVVFPKP